MIRKRRRNLWLVLLRREYRNNNCSRSSRKVKVLVLRVGRK